MPGKIVYDYTKTIKVCQGEAGEETTTSVSIQGEWPPCCKKEWKNIEALVSDGLPCDRCGARAVAVCKCGKHVVNLFRVPKHIWPENYEERIRVIKTD